MILSDWLALGREMGKLFFALEKMQRKKLDRFIWGLVKETLHQKKKKFPVNKEVNAVKTGIETRNCEFYSSGTWVSLIVDGKNVDTDETSFKRETLILQ